MQTLKLSMYLAGTLLTCVTIGNGTARAGGLFSVDWGDASFTTPTDIDNPYWPLNDWGSPKQYQTFVYHADAEDGCEINTITVDPALTKSFAAPYDGVTAIVVLDTAWVVDSCLIVPGDGDLVELTHDWYAQDDIGNIWYMGEESRSFEDGCPPLGEVPPLECTEGSWEAGQYGPDMEIIAEPGIVVPRHPEPGMFYMQEVAEGAEDMAKVLRLNASVTLEEGSFAGTYTGCMKTKEWTALDHGSVEHKFYCPNSGSLGLVFIEELHGKTVKVELVGIIPP